MKTTILTGIIFSAAAAVFAQQPQAPEGGPPEGPPPQTMPAPPPVDPTEQFTPEEMMEMYGFYIASQTGLRDLNFLEEEVDAFFKGFETGVETAEPPYDFEEMAPYLQAFLQEKQAVAQQEAIEAGRAEAEAFFAELAERDDVIQTDSGLFYEILEQGDGDAPGDGDTVRIHYHGTLINGEVFDSSRDRGQPAEFPVGGVIPGMSEGLQLLSTGSEAIFYIPAELAYGEQGQATIPPGSTLIFEVELIEVLEQPEAAPAPEVSWP